MLNRQLPFGVKIVQEDSRTQQAVKRVREYLEQQHETLITIGSKPHEIDCEDPVQCTKEICWVWQPDKIVSEPYQVERACKK